MQVSTELLPPNTRGSHTWEERLYSEYLEMESMIQADARVGTDAPARLGQNDCHLSRWDKVAYRLI